LIKDVYEIFGVTNLEIEGKTMEATAFLKVG